MYQSFNYWETNKYNDLNFTRLCQKFDFIFYYYFFLSFLKRCTWWVITIGDGLLVNGLPTRTPTLAKVSRPDRTGTPTGHPVTVGPPRLSQASRVPSVGATLDTGTIAYTRDNCPRSWHNLVYTPSMNWGQPLSHVPATNLTHQYCTATWTPFPSSTT